MALKLPKIEDVIPVRHLCRDARYFWCPYCEKSWTRGGVKEGFVKSGASNHVASCRDIVLFDAGYLPALVPNWGRAIPIANALKQTAPTGFKNQTAGDIYRRMRRLILASKASRRRADLVPRRPR